MNPLVLKQIGSIQLLDTTRANFDDSVQLDELKKLAKVRTLRVLQCYKPVQDAVWDLVNQSFFSLRPDVQLRVFSFLSTERDLAFTRFITNVRHFAVDGHQNAKNIEAIANLSLLESLSVGLFELKDFHFLELVPKTLANLSLESTRSKNISLLPLKRFKALQGLYLEGQNKDIEVISELKQLKKIVLRSITTKDLAYLSKLSHLWSLDIKLGGIRDFYGIEGKEMRWPRIDGLSAGAG